ncbi:hypothetical protein O7623_29050 [Solwaraspora sp. WMMD791]|uniref:hypothetical protein n=1 Tax=Solwaraspora sp. WMMD791 TaxID=3016086 RepID=UPI00249AFD01|nr:hypothetical protein [Solwaraspora sp. WMMD791]WFE27241.1 hypothetical protein O7623_29050 [Solwaraspora sp. WMMD791]
MIYTSSGVGSARRWIRWWPAATAVAAVALGGLLLLALVACGSGTGRLSGHPDADDAAGSAGLGGAPAATGSSGAGPADGGPAGSGGDHGDDGGAEHDPGGSGGNGGNGDDTGVEVTAAAEDCVGYDPANLTIQQQGDAWLMRDGNHAIKNFATKADAEDGVKVARNWTRICYIGRGNDRPDRHRYIVTYFQGPSGLPFGLAPRFDCIPYDPVELAVHGPDGGGWELRAAATPLLVLASAADAERARLVAGGNRQLCVIGQGNGMPDPARYQLEHWRQ